MAQDEKKTNPDETGRRARGEKENLGRGCRKANQGKRGAWREWGSQVSSLPREKLKTKRVIGINKKVMGEFGESSFTGSMSLNATLEYVEQWESEWRQLKKGMRESQRKDRILF